MLPEITATVNGNRVNFEHLSSELQFAIKVMASKQIWQEDLIKSNGNPG